MGDVPLSASKVYEFSRGRRRNEVLSRNYFPKWVYAGAMATNGMGNQHNSINYLPEIRMILERFESICTNIHVADDAHLLQDDKFARIRSFF